jgi:hypothetical protein
MSVTKSLVAAAGWSMGAAFQRDRQAEVRPCAAGDDSVAEAQGTTREQAKGRRIIRNAPLCSFTLEIANDEKNWGRKKDESSRQKQKQLLTR